MAHKKLDVQTLEAALIGYEHQLNLIHAKIAKIREKLGKSAKSAASSERSKLKRFLSATARKTIAVAQKKRGAAYRKATRGEEGTSGTGPRIKL
jgi:hypothetical protein